MTDNEAVLNDLVSAIGAHTSFRPTRSTIGPFAERLAQVRIDDLLVHAYIHHHGTWVEDLVLATYTYWQTFKREDWQSVFNRVAGHRHAEYYITVTARRCLGIDPGFDSAKDIEVVAITLPDMQSQVTSAFIPNLTGKIRELEEDRLTKIGISMNDLVAINSRL